MKVIGGLLSRVCGIILGERGKDVSYTLTIDEPSVASYMTRRGPQFHEEFNALLVAYVQTRMSYDQVPMPECKPRSGLDLFRCLRENAPLLDEDEVRLFDRVKDCGREVGLA